MQALFSIIHVGAAVFIAGPIAILPMASLQALRVGDTVRAAAAAKTIRLLIYLSLITVITGFGVMGMADSKFNLSITTPWVLGSLVLYAIVLILGIALVMPSFEHPGRRSARSTYVRAAAGSGIATIALIGTVVLMVWKP